MLDIKKIRENKEEVLKGLQKRINIESLDNIIELDDKRKSLRQKKSELQELRNNVSKEISILKRTGKDANEKIIYMREVGDEIDELNNKINEVETLLTSLLSALPNIPDPDVIAGGKENNEIIYKYKEQTKFDFQPKDHLTLAKELNLVDYDRGVKLGGQGNWIYIGLGAQLEWALINYCINSHLLDGWQFMLVPHMLNYECGYTAGQFPKFQEEVYWIDGNYRKNGKFMAPTAETALVNIHRNEIIKEDELPKKYFSYTPCYRREAGSSRIEERGTIRGHQFNKIEMVEYTTEKNSDLAFEELLTKAENLVKGLELHYQVSKLAAQDCSASMCKTYDVEVWIPSIKTYKEVSSVSNARDYQARRGNIKYKDSLTGNNKFVHTLNGSGLATSRLFPAILEQYQNADGSITIPEILRPYMNNLEKIEKRSRHLSKKLEK